MTSSRGRRTQRRQAENRAAREQGRAPGWRERDRRAAAMVQELDRMSKIKPRRKRAK